LVWAIMLRSTIVTLAPTAGVEFKKMTWPSMFNSSVLLWMALLSIICHIGPNPRTTDPAIEPIIIVRTAPNISKNPATEGFLLLRGVELYCVGE
jgi:hypothetical protein